LRPRVVAAARRALEGHSGTLARPSVLAASFAGCGGMALLRR
jgi:hypothetical protein